MRHFFNSIAAGSAEPQLGLSTVDAKLGLGAPGEAAFRLQLFQLGGDIGLASSGPYLIEVVMY